MSMEEIESLGEGNRKILDATAGDILYNLASRYPPPMVMYMLLKLALATAGKREFLQEVYDANNRCG